MARRKRIYEVSSTYMITGTANIEAYTAAEAAEIGLFGAEDGGQVQFVFSEPHHETKMRARLTDDTYVSEIKPVSYQPARDRDEDGQLAGVSRA